MTTATTSDLRNALLGSYPDAAFFGAPVIGIHRGDETAAAWRWLLGLVQKRTDWRPAIGIALQHAAQDGGELARGALADFLESFQASIVLLEWTEPMAKRWPDAVATQRGTSFGSPDYRLETIVRAQRELWDMAQPETGFSAEGAGPNGDWLIVEGSSQADLELMLAATAKVDRFSDGKGAWHWTTSALRFHSELEPMMVEACKRFARGTDHEVRAMLDWFSDEHDLWRYVDLLDELSRNPPAWWNEPANSIPPGWQFPVRPTGLATLGDAALRALARAKEQAATTIVIDLPRLFPQDSA